MKSNMIVLVLNISILVFLSILGGLAGYVIGVEDQKKYDIEYCKLAGWEFIEETIRFPNPHTKQSLIALRHFQSKISTKCINKIGQDNDLLKIVEL
jgi:hypothetical protein